MFDNNDFNNEKSELQGFDEATKSGAEPLGDTDTQNESFYTKKKEDIIQDTPFTSSYYNKESHNNTFEADFKATSYAEPKSVKKDKKKYGAGVVLAASFMAAVIGAVGGITATMFDTRGNAESPSSSQGASNVTNVNINVDETAESVVEAVADKVMPSVVGIRTTTSVTSFFGGSKEESGEGSGVVYTADGYVITNYHVISDAIQNRSKSKIEVFLESDDTNAYEAQVVGYNISTDLAVLKINASGLTPIEIANSDELKVGRFVITVGNPGGLEFMDSVTFGVISGLDRVVSSDSDLKLIQTDAAINPGNSGGALVNTKGELVGINSSKIVSEDYEGMGFAIPSNTVVEVCRKIIENENSPEPYTGITISEKYTASVLQYYGYPTGAVVLSVADGSPAAEAGLRRGDIITEYKGVAITEYTVLDDLMNNSTPDEVVSLTVYRSGRYYNCEMQIGSNNQID